MSLLLALLGGGGGGGNVGNAAGAATVSGVSGLAGTGASAGVATATAVGAATSSGVGSSAGVATASAVGQAQVLVAGSSNGLATVTAVGAAIANSVGDSTGVATVNGIASDPVGISITNATFLYDETDASSYTFTSAFIGAASGDRDVILCITCSAASVPAINSVTIGGNAATIVVNSTGTQTRAAIAVLRVPSGTNADIVVTTSANALRMVIDVLRMTGAVTTVVTDTDGPAGGGDAARTNTIDVEAGGNIVSTALGTGASMAWTNSTETNDQVPTAGYNQSTAVYAASGAESGRVITATSCRVVVSAAFRAEPDNVGASAGVATASAVGQAQIRSPGASAGVATVAATNGSFFDPLLKAAGSSNGRATVIGTRQGVNYPFGSSTGKATAFAYPLGFISRLRRNGVIIPNLRYGPSQVARAYYNRQLLFQNAVSSQGAGMSAGIGAPVGIGDFNVPAAAPSLASSGIISAANATTHTVTGISIGAVPPGGDRRILALVVGAANTTGAANLEVLTASIAGNNMTRAAMAKHTSGAACSTLSIFVLELNSGTTGDLILTYNLATTFVYYAMHRVKIFGGGVGLVDADISEAVDPSPMTLITNKGTAVIAGTMILGAGNPPATVWAGVDASAFISSPGIVKGLGAAFRAVQIESSAYPLSADCTAAPTRICAASVSIGP